jgi:uncharacterized Zn-binding protein involved in type VI secretion
MDIHVCSTPNPIPHVGGPIIKGSSTVLSNGLPQARSTDQCLCAGGPPNFIVTGSSTVLVDKFMAVRMTDKTMHPPPGMIVIGSPNILIGGPTAGCTLGGGPAARKACQAAAGGRASGSTQQSMGNCGLESCRQLINQNNPNPISEQNLYNQAVKDGNAGVDPKLSETGGTSPAERQAVLAKNGVPSSLQDPTMENIQQNVAEGRGVITSHDCGKLWGNSQTGGHAILVTGVHYDENGNPDTVITNDTGVTSGNCARSVPVNQFKNSLRPGRQMNVTNNRVW